MMAPQTLLTRDQVAGAAKMAMLVMDDETRPQWVRDEAREVFEALDQNLRYDTPDEVRVCPVPAEFYGPPGWYTQETKRFIANLPARVRDAQPVLVQMARQTADLVDTEEFSFEMMVDNLNALNLVLESLRLCLEPDCPQAEREEREGET